MSFQSWLPNLQSTLARRRAKRRAKCRHKRPNSLRTTTHRLNFEVLEDRALLAFVGPVDYSVGSDPVAVLAADFNNDTVLDLAVANYVDSTVSVLLGDGNGAFPAPSVNTSTGANPQSLAVGDFNGDGNMDLATATAGDVSVLLGDGHGAFPAASNIDFSGLGSSPSSMAVGDFNGDGLLDLGVTANSYQPGTPGYWGYYSYYPGSPGYYEGSANVLLGNGGGGFSGPNTTWLGYGYHTAAAVADFNGDHIDDFATFNTDYGAVSVLLGDLSGSLQGPTGSFYTGDYSYTIAAGDLDGDGNNDLVTANANGNSVSVFPGDGLGGFSGPFNYDTGEYPTSIVLGDFTHDGQIDVATTNYSTSRVSVLYGEGAGVFSTPAISSAGFGPRAIAAGDFNGDGWLDAATANQGDNTVSVLLNDRSWPNPPPPPPPFISIDDVTVTEGNTGVASATFTVSLSGAYDQDVTVHFQTADASATAGSDYTAATGDVTVPAGSTSQSFTVAVLGDRVAESTENFVVNLSAPVNGTIRDSQGSVTILDDEPRVSINDVTVTEGNTGSVAATFTLTLSAASDVDVTVHYATANGTAAAGSDYTAAAGDVIIPHGQISRTLSVAVTGDRLSEPTETYFVNLSAPINAGIADDQGVGTIVDNEPRISISDVSKAEGKNRQTTQFTFTVTLSAAYDQAVTVSYKTTDGTAKTSDKDYVAQTGTITFNPGETTQTITIVVNGDNKKEATETFYLDLFGNSGNSLFTKSRGSGTILRDD